VTLTEDRDLFGRLLIVANVRQVNVREILCDELSTLPFTLELSGKPPTAFYSRIWKIT